MSENLCPGVDDFRADISDEVAIEALMQRVKPAAIAKFAAGSHVNRSLDGARTGRCGGDASSAAERGSFRRVVMPYEAQPFHYRRSDYHLLFNSMVYRVRDQVAATGHMLYVADKGN